MSLGIREKQNYYSLNLKLIIWAVLKMIFLKSRKISVSVLFLVAFVGKTRMVITTTLRNKVITNENVLRNFKVDQS